MTSRRSPFSKSDREAITTLAYEAAAKANALGVDTVWIKVAREGENFEVIAGAPTSSTGLKGNHKNEWDDLLK